VHSRFLITLLAAAAVAPQLAAEDCEWPAATDAPPPPAAGADGIAVADPAKLPIKVTSGGAEVTRQGDATLRDGVVVEQGDRRLSARSATYEAATERFDVEGDVEYSAPNLRLKGASGYWNAAGGGQFTGTEFELPERPARGSAAVFGMTTTGELNLREVSFTACPIGNDDWFLRAASIDIDQRSQQGKGRNVRIELKGVPILYAPLISFPVGDARKSGLLFPSFGTSNKSGFELGVPYYFNLAPNYDLTLAPQLLTRRGFGMDGQFRYLNGIRADRADGIYLRNFTTQIYEFNAVYALETDGFVFDRLLSRWVDEYAYLSFACDHALYESVDGYGAADSVIYPGSGADIYKTATHADANLRARQGTEIRNSTGRHAAGGYSGTAGNSPWVHNSRFFKNQTGLATESIFGGHPGMPQDHGLFENNLIYNNNKNY